MVSGTHTIPCTPCKGKGTIRKYILFKQKCIWCKGRGWHPRQYGKRSWTRGTNMNYE